MEKETLHVGPEDQSSIPAQDPNLKKLAGVWSVFGPVKYPKLVKIGTWLSGICLCAAIIIYVTLGATHKQYWSKCWCIFILFPVLPSLFTAIGRGKATTFLFPLLAIGLYCALGSNGVNGFWHPGWVMLFSIPVYYAIVIPVGRYLKKKKIKQIFSQSPGIDNQ